MRYIRSNVRRPTTGTARCFYSRLALRSFCKVYEAQRIDTKGKASTTSSATLTTRNTQVTDTVRDRQCGKLHHRRETALMYMMPFATRRARGQKTRPSREHQRSRRAACISKDNTRTRTTTHNARPETTKLGLRIPRETYAQLTQHQR